MKPSGIGGMAVIEGVMMKNKDEYAIAVRKPNNEIVVEKSKYQDFSNKVKLFKLPIFRGILAFIDSMVVGIKVINFSASFFEEEEEDSKKKKDNKKKKGNTKKSKDIESEATADVFEEISAVDSNQENSKMNAMLMAVAVVVSIIISVSLFMVLPVLISSLFSRFVQNAIALSFLEGMIRLIIFIGYVLLVSLTPDIKRVFMYHGAEHKTINCLENGFELSVENVRWQSKQHKRCGTSFMLFVMILSFIFFIFLPTYSLLWRVVSRILLVPIIAGISYEFIRLAGKSESKFVDILSKPGLWMQGLTTKEPDDQMIEVAIESVGAVFNWREFLETSVSEESSNSIVNTSKENTSSKAGTSKASKSKANVSKTDTSKAVKSKTNASKTASDTDASKTDTSKSNASNTASKTVSVASTSKVNKSEKKSVQNMNKEVTSSVSARSIAPSEEEDDEILRALDKYLDTSKKEA